MKLRVKTVFFKSKPRVLSGLAKDTENSTDLLESSPSYTGPGADGAIESLADPHIGHPEPWFEKTFDSSCSVTGNCSREWSLEMDLREWRGWQKVTWDRTGMGTIKVSKIKTRPPENGKAAVQRSVSKRWEFETSTSLSHPERCGKDWFLVGWILIVTYLIIFFSLPDIHVTQCAISMYTHSTDCE